MSASRQIAVWLFIVAGSVAAMVLVGGLTRLTDSGLSITEWDLVRGTLPPLSAEAWQLAFEKYRAIPEYVLVNRGMSLAEFKVIYWWEWAHRFMGRLVGLIFLVPFLVFYIQGKITRRSMPALLGLFALGAAQGFMGWYMVQSGLVGRVDVSQYRLAAHLGLALIIFAWSFWLGLRYWVSAQEMQGRDPVQWKGAGILLILVFCQCLLGALVAGLNAGATYTDWPLMDGDFIPQGIFAQTPLVRNFFENIATVQFIHRLGGYVVFVAALWHLYYVRRREAVWVAIAVVAQMALGVATLLMAVPLVLGALHQMGAVLVLGLAVFHFFQISRLQSRF